MDFNGRGNPESVRVRGSRLQEKHGEHDKGRRHSPGKIQGEVREIPESHPVRRGKGIL